MERSTQSVKYSKANATEEHESGSERYSYDYVSFSDYEELDIEELKDFIGEQFPERDVDDVVVNIINSGIKDFMRKAKDPASGIGGTPRELKTFGTFVAHLSDPGRADAYKAGLIRANPGFAERMVSIQGLLVEDDDEEDDEPVATKPKAARKGKKGRK